MRVAGADINHVNAGHGTANHQRVADIIASIAYESQGQAFQKAEIFLDCLQIGQYLSWMPFVGESIPHRHTGIVGEVFDDILAETAEKDAVKHSAENTGAVGNGFFFAEVDILLSKIFCAAAFIANGDHCGTMRTGGGFLKDQADITPLEQGVLQVLPAAFALFKGNGQVHQPKHLSFTQVGQFQKAFILQVEVGNIHGIP